MSGRVFVGLTVRAGPRFAWIASIKKATAGNDVEVWGIVLFIVYCGTAAWA